MTVTDPPRAPGKVAVPTMEVSCALKRGEMTILPEVDPPEYAYLNPPLSVRLMVSAGLVRVATFTLNGPAVTELTEFVAFTE